MIHEQLFQELGKHYIVIIDQYSGFPMVGQFQTPPSTNSVLNHFEHWFNLFGVPEELVSDNGPQYDSTDYKAYAEERKIRLVHSSPYHSSGNGLAEAAVKNVKKLLKKHQSNWKNFQRALMLWRNFPNKSQHCTRSTLQLTLSRESSAPPPWPCSSRPTRPSPSRTSR